MTNHYLCSPKPASIMDIVRRLVIVIFVGIILCEGRVSAQIVQYGKVVEMNAKGKTMSGVSVSVPSASDCQPAMTDAFGLFRLSFSEHQTGDVIRGLKVRKYGYEVVNLHVTRDGWTLTTRDTLRIVMAPIGKLTEARMRYYDLLETAALSRYDATRQFFKAKYASHEISEVEYQYWMAQAETELQQAYENMDDYADQFARANEDDMNEESRQLLQRLSANDLDGAVALLAGGNHPTVLQAYNDFSIAFPLEHVEENKAGVLNDSIVAADSLYEHIIVLQTYTNLFEGDFKDSGLRYAKSCMYLGRIFKDKGWNDASRIYLTKALRMYEMLETMGITDNKEQMEKLKEWLEMQ